MVATLTPSQQFTVSTPIVRLDDPDHELAIYQQGDWRGWRSKAVKKEPWTFDWIKEIGTGVLYDVGACVGSYSLMAAARGATVVAFEPVPWNYAECMANVHLNGLQGRINVLPVAVGAEDGTAGLKHPPGPIPGFGEGGGGYTHFTWVLHIPQIALANLYPAYPRPTHIKVDVEGGEVKVLQGADLSTAESVIVEVRDDATEADVMMLMGGRGFESAWNGGRRTENQRTHIFRRKS